MTFVFNQSLYSGKVSIKRMLIIYVFLNLVTPSFSTDTKSPIRSIQDRVDHYEELMTYYDYISFDSAIYTGLKYVRLADSLRNPKLQVKSRRLLASAYESTGLTDQASQLLYEALAISRSTLIEDHLVASVYQGLGWVYEDLEDDSLSEYYFREAISIVDKTGNSSLLGHAYYCLGSHFWATEYIDSSIFYLTKAYHLLPFDSLTSVPVELAQAYAFAGDSENARKVLNELPVGYGEYDGYIKAYIQSDWALIYLLEGNYQESIDNHLEVLRAIDSMGLGYAEEAVHAREYILEAAKKLGDKDMIIRMYEEIRARESRWRETSKEMVTKVMEIENETALKEELINAQASSLVQQRRIISLTVAISVIFLVSILIVSRLLVLTKRKSDKIEVLMRELHHRVKNNLQVISSMLGLQSRKLDDEAKVAVEEGKERIRAMSLIHQKLYQDDQVSTLDIKDYITNLVNELSQAYGYSEKAKIDLDISDLRLNVDTSLPIGLIVNELVTNAFKYAYRDIEKPILELKLLVDEDNLLLSVRDNGVGLPEGYSIENARSFGMKLVNILVAQLKGSLELDHRHGLNYRIKFQRV